MRDLNEHIVSRLRDRCVKHLGRVSRRRRFHGAAIDAARCVSLAAMRPAAAVAAALGFPSRFFSLGSMWLCEGAMPDGLRRRPCSP